MKMKLVIILLAAAVLTGCSVFAQIDQSVNYTNEAATYVNQATEFVGKLPDMAQQAATDPEMKEKLVADLEAMKQRVVEFDALEAPAFASEVHAKLQEYNATFQQDIDQVLNGLLDDIPAVQAVKDSQIVQTLTEITRLLEQINNLGG